MGENIGYVRVSSAEQNPARQLDALAGFCVQGKDKIFIEYQSGKNISDRPELQKMLEYIREGDTVYVSELSRLGRSVRDLLNLIEQIKEKGASFRSVKENFETETPSGKLQFTMLAAISEFERDTIRERQAEGIAIAKEKGVYKGRKAKSIENIDELIKKRNMGVSVAQLAREVGVSRPTLYKIFKEKGVEV